MAFAIEFLAKTTFKITTAVMKILDRIFDGTMGGLQRALDLSWRRNEAIVSNIANAETPQYRAVDLNFGDELKRAFDATTKTLDTTHSGHQDVGTQGAAHLQADHSGATKADGNNVDIDIQMGKLAHNGGQYSIASNLMRKKLQTLSTIIRQSV